MTFEGVITLSPISRGTSPVSSMHRADVEQNSERHSSSRPLAAQTTFNARELNLILNVYARHVALGEWRDYALDFLKDRAVFSIFRRTSESPLYRIEKRPSLRTKQGEYAVIAPGGLILKRGNDLARTLKTIDKPTPLHN
jgi:Protein of unknown function (DUF2794)